MKEMNNEMNEKRATRDHWDTAFIFHFFISSLARFFSCFISAVMKRSKSEFVTMLHASFKCLHPLN